MVFSLPRLQMATSSEDSDSNYEAQPSDEEKKGKSKDKKDKKDKVVAKKAKNDKKDKVVGRNRFSASNSPLKGMNVGLPVEELKRKAEDEELRKAEKKKHKNRDGSAPSSSNNNNARNSDDAESMKGKKFSEKEVRAILQSIHAKLSDQEASVDFFRQLPHSSRTAKAVKARVKIVREELEASLLHVKENEIEKNGNCFLLGVPCRFFSFFRPGCTQIFGAVRVR